MTEFPGTDSGQIAYQVTGLTATAEEAVAARPASTYGSAHPGQGRWVRH